MCVCVCVCVSKDCADTESIVLGDIQTLIHVTVRSIVQAIN